MNRMLQLAAYPLAFCTSSIALAKDKTIVAKKIAALPGFWEMIGGFMGVMTVGFLAYRFTEHWLKKLGYIKEPIQEELQKVHAEQLSMIMRLDERMARIQPLLDRLLPIGIPLEKTEFYRIVDKLDAMDVELLREIVVVLREHSKQHKDIVRILRYMARSGDNHNIEFILGDED